MICFRRHCELLVHFGVNHYKALEWYVSTTVNSHQKAQSFTRYIHVHHACVSHQARWKFDQTKWRRAFKTTLCCLPPIPFMHGSASEVNWSDANAQVVDLLSPVSCFSSICWGVNCLLYLWTHSLACRHLLSSQSTTSIMMALVYKTGIMIIVYSL